MAALLYEGVVLFGVLMISGLLYGALTNQRHALTGRVGLQVVLFLILGLYFAGFWAKSGQTVAMKTWHIRVVDARHGGPISAGRAWVRYLLSWLWFLPALGVAALADWTERGPVAVALLGGMLAYALLARALPAQQFLHDRLAGTRLVTWRPLPR